MMKNLKTTPPHNFCAKLFVIFLFIQFNLFSQSNTEILEKLYRPIYSLKDESSKRVSTLRLETTRFLVYQSFATTSNAIASKDFTDALARTRNQITQADIIPIGILNAELTLFNSQKKELIIASSRGRCPHRTSCESHNSFSLFPSQFV